MSRALGAGMGRVVLALGLGLVALSAAGCEDLEGDGDMDVADTGDAASDADATPIETPPNPIFDALGEVTLIELWSPITRAVEGTEVSARLWSKPDPNLQRIAAVSGDCQLWTRPPALCEPPCNAFTEACVPGPRCESLPEGRSAGALTITGGAAPITLNYVGNGQYASAADPPGDLFDAGDGLAIEAAGGAIPAFSAAINGVADLDDALDPIALVDGSATTVTWAPANDGSTIELVLQLGWHANPPEGVIYCTAPDSDGAIVIGREVVEGFPYFEGSGLFQVPSWAQRVSRATVETPGGPIAVYAASRQMLTVTHTPQR